MSGVRKTSSTGAASAAANDVSRGRPQAATADRVERTDSAGITGKARELAGALHLVEESPEVRAEKVRALREQIANGTYNPDPREVARKMVERGF